MSKTLMCLSEATPFYSQELCKDSTYGTYETFPTGSPANKCPKIEGNGTVHPSSSPQDENKYANYNCSTNDVQPSKQTLPRKREASNILMECVKRRDNLRNIDSASSVPCQTFNCAYDNISSELMSDCVATTDLESDICVPKQGDVAESIEFSDSIDSGIESSKSSSPVHSIETSSSCCLEEEICENLMEIDEVGSPVPKATDSVQQDQEIVVEQDAKSVEFTTAEHLGSLHLTEELGQEASTNSKSPITQSLFKNVPSMIYFSSKNESVQSMPDNVLRLMKWKLSTVTPAVIRQTVLKAGFSIVEADSKEDWLGTWGKHLKCTAFRRLKKFQKVNHYPGGFHLGRKDRLWENYVKMVNKHGTQEFGFFPDTYILPADLKSLKEAWGNDTDNSWIVKPCASARGSGVKVIYKWSQVPKNRPFVVQRYISNPYLINGSKFDLRLYVMIPSIEPLRVYVFEDGLVRFASEKYSLANKSFANRFIHLTNYSINRKSSSYASNDDENTCQGHKWSLKSFWAYMSNSGIDIAKIQETITDMIIKTVISAENPICRMVRTNAKSSYNCFELFGFDIMLDKDLHPWLLEVNITPSLHTKSVLDSNIKGPMVKDMLNLAGFEVVERLDSPVDDNILGNRHKSLRNRRITQEERRKHAVYSYGHSDADTDILDNLTLDDVHCLVESEDELQRRGSFTRVFPTESTYKYFALFEHTRYYNVLLDAWEKAYHSNRSEGIKLLQQKCVEMFVPKAVAVESTELEIKTCA